MGRADKVFINGEVITVNRANQTAEALAVKGNKITFVGSSREAREHIGSQTELIDLKGKSLLPGFIDAHQHLQMRGNNALAIDCRPPGVTSIAQLKSLIAQKAARTPQGEWIRGWGYDHSKLAENRHPDRFDLDEAAPGHPVILVRVCNHIGAFNSKALELMAVSPEARSIRGAPVGERNGRPNGVMFEAAFMETAGKSAPSEHEMADALAKAGNMLLSEGITSVHDAGGYGFAQMKALQTAVETGKLRPRIYAMLFSLNGDSGSFSSHYIDSGIRTNFGNDRLKLGPVKMMIDGSSSGPTAATLEDYSSMPGNRGLLSLDQDYIDDMVLRGHRAGYQVTAHAVGDRAVTMILNAYEKALLAYPRAGHRHRIEHCGIVNPALLKRIKAMEIIPVPQPVFLWEFGDGYVRNYGQRAHRMFTAGSFARHGIVAAGSSDCPVTFANPLLNIHVAVNRMTQTGLSVGPYEAIPVMEAIRLFTYNSAYASFDEKIKGSLEAGKLADLALLSRSLLKADKNEIKDITVEQTFLDGEMVYSG
ncbi:MAG: amidohydrolase [Desulfarculales bacterium]|jgi:predicted amidohydrolase YtcJ|nr:amidohydrolase [Desulfarculales bacterium]